MDRVASNVGLRSLAGEMDTRNLIQLLQKISYIWSADNDGSRARIVEKVVNGLSKCLRILTLVNAIEKQC
jgi:hypothetical protein